MIFSLKVFSASNSFEPLQTSHQFLVWTRIRACTIGFLVDESCPAIHKDENAMQRIVTLAPPPPPRSQRNNEEPGKRGHFYAIESGHRSLVASSPQSCKSGGLLGSLWVWA